MEAVNYERVNFNTAEKIATKKEIPIGLFVAGGVLVIFAALIGVFYYMVISKRIRRKEG